jgi:DDE family transposase
LLLPLEEVWNEEQWQQLLRDRMPEDWQEQAIKTKAWQRTRKLACIGDLLRALLVYAAYGYSFRQLGIWATALGLGSLSERAWRKRVERAGDWIMWLMGALIGTQATPGWIRQGLGRILLIDATRLKLPAGTGDDMRLHCAYDLRAGRLAHVEISDCHGAEGLHHFELQAGDIVVTDSGYPLGACVQQGQKQGAFGVHRVSNHQVRFEREDGQKIDLKRLVKHQGYGTMTERTVWIWDSKHKERMKVRLVIEVLPRKPAAQARKRKREHIKRKHGPKHSMASAWWGGVLLLVSTLPQEQWSAPEVVKLYRARWQIELVFKRLKQGLLLHVLPMKIWERAKIYLHLCLIVWSLQEQEVQVLSEQLAGLLQEPVVGEALPETEEEDLEPQWVLSHWQLMRTQLDRLRMLLHGTWSSRRWQDCLPLLLRYFASRRRPKRVSQETEVLAWLQKRASSLAKKEVAA